MCFTWFAKYKDLLFPYLIFVLEMLCVDSEVGRGFLNISYANITLGNVKTVNTPKYIYLTLTLITVNISLTQDKALEAIVM